LNSTDSRFRQARSAGVISEFHGQPFPLCRQRLRHWLSGVNRLDPQVISGGGFAAAGSGHLCCAVARPDAHP
jgi:hypothetical protein